MRLQITEIFMAHLIFIRMLKNKVLNQLLASKVITHLMVESLVRCWILVEAQRVKIKNLVEANLLTHTSQCGLQPQKQCITYLEFLLFQVLKAITTNQDLIMNYLKNMAKDLLPQRDVHLGK